MLSFAGKRLKEFLQAFEDFPNTKKASLIVTKNKKKTMDTIVPTLCEIWLLISQIVYRIQRSSLLYVFFSLWCPLFQNIYKIFITEITGNFLQATTTLRGRPNCTQMI